MKQEPVAWMQTHYKTGKPTRFSQVKTWEDDVPLYTAPRELNEVEILELWTKKNRLDGANGIIEFARAILKKASEK
jgi:hypothetical protein